MCQRCHHDFSLSSLISCTKTGRARCHLGCGRGAVSCRRLGWRRSGDAELRGKSPIIVSDVFGVSSWSWWFQYDRCMWCLVPGVLERGPEQVAYHQLIGKSWGNRSLLQTPQRQAWWQQERENDATVKKKKGRFSVTDNVATEDALGVEGMESALQIARHPPKPSRSKQNQGQKPRHKGRGKPAEMSLSAFL